MATPTSRSAGLLAAAIAVPIALVAGLLVYSTLHGRISANAAASPTSSASRASASATANGPVAMPAPSMPAAQKQMCLAFIAALPTSVRTLPERHVTAGPEQNAAFGDPPITAECDATEPHVAPTDEIYPISGVCWYAQQTANATVWTTLDRVVPVAITIPNSYTSPGQWATEFRDAIVEALPSKKTPYNC